MDPVVHFEIPTDDMNRAQKFYESVFGWKINAWDPGYFLVMTSEVDEKMMPKKPGNINGGMLKRTEPITSPVITINVDSIDECVKKVEAEGGKLIYPKKKIGMIGFSAYIRDSEGNTIGLFETLSAKSF